jgi:RNA polymerase sigma-70 factor (ECF subfamily)
MSDPGNIGRADRTVGRNKVIDVTEERRTFEAMVREHEPVLRSIALKLCKDAEEARDIVQDTLERAYKGFATKPAGSSPRAWLATILRNRFIDEWRRSVLLRKMEDTVEKLAQQPPAEEPAEGWSTVTDDQLAKAVEGLDEEFRLVYVMHAVEGRSYQEIASVLGIPKPTVGTRLLRARRKLRDALLAQGWRK